MARREKLYSVDEFLEIARAEENQAKRLELDEGMIVEMPPSSQKNTVIAMRIGRLLGNFVDERDLGYVTGPDGGFQLSSNTVRQPDVAFISKARHPDLDGVVFPLAPDLVVEVMSPTEDIWPKVNQYFAAGTRLVWTVDVKDETISVWQLAAQGGLHVQTYSAGNIIDGGDVLPGFMLPLRDVFPAVQAE